VCPSPVAYGLSRLGGYAWFSMFAMASRTDAGGAHRRWSKPALLAGLAWCLAATGAEARLAIIDWTAPSAEVFSAMAVASWALLLAGWAWYLMNG
jgi:hypothetical protein